MRPPQSGEWTGDSEPPHLVVDSSEYVHFVHYLQIMYKITAITYLDTWILGVVSKQLRLLHGPVVDSTTSVNYLSSQMSELVEDAVAS